MNWNNNSNLPVGRTVVAELNGGDYVCLTRENKKDTRYLIYKIDTIFGSGVEKTTIYASADSVKRWAEIE